MKAPPPAAMAAWLALAGLAACGPRSGPSTEGYWAERKAAAADLQLWSIEVVGASAAPVRICMDTAMRIGLVKPAPSAGATPCIRLSKPVEAPGRYAFRCQLGDREWAVASLWRGDRERDFTDAVLISSLDPPFATYHQSRRYRRLGACPAGWSAGDTRGGNRRGANGLIAWPAEASAPP